MGVPFKASVILMVAMLAGAQANPVLRGQMCHFVAQMCATQLQNATAGFQQNVDIDRACQAVPVALNCLGSCLGVIVGNPAMERALHSVLEYICQEDRRAFMTQIAETPCVNDGSFQLRFQSEATECTQRMMADAQSAVFQAMMNGQSPESVMCPLLDGAMDCIDEKVEEICDATVVPFVNDIFMIVLRELLIDQMPTCFDRAEATHSVVKRAVEYLKLFRK